METKASVKKREKLTRIEKYWIIYDVGNSAFTMVAASLFALFFQLLVDNVMGAGSESTAYGNTVYAAATAIITVLSVLLEPLFGAMSDSKGVRKPLFLIFTVIGVMGCMVLGLPMHYIAWICVLCLTRIFYNGALMIYDSMLVDVTTDNKADKVSAYGYAFGYIGSCIPFLIGVAVAAFGFQSFDLQPGEVAGMAHSLTVPWGYLICFIINALWWLCFALPLYTNYKQTHGLATTANLAKGKRGISVKESYSRVLHTIKDVNRNKGILLFLVAFFLYIDGVYSIIDLAMKIASSLGGGQGIDNVQALIALVSVQFIAFPASILTGVLAKKIRTDYMIGFFIIGYLFITIFGVFINGLWMFWILAVAVGLCQGGIQSMSRSYLTLIIDKDKSGEIFSLFDTFGKGASFLGTMLFSIINAILSQSSDPFIRAYASNFSIIPLSVLVLSGGIVFIFASKVNEPVFLKKRAMMRKGLSEETTTAAGQAQINWKAYTDRRYAPHENLFVTADGKEFYSVH